METARWRDTINVDDLWEGDMTAVTVDGETKTISTVGTGAGSTTSVGPAAVGDTVLHVASVTNFAPGTPLTVGGQTVSVMAVGTAAGAARPPHGWRVRRDGWVREVQTGPMSAANRGPRGKRGKTKKTRRRTDLPVVRVAPEHCDCPACSDLDPAQLLDELLEDVAPLAGYENATDAELAGAVFMALATLSGDDLVPTFVNELIPQIELFGREILPHFS